MTRSRSLFYGHLALVITCASLALVALEYQARMGHSPVFLYRLFELGSFQLGFGAVFLSCWLFPLAIAYLVVRRMQAWRWGAVVMTDIVLGLVQCVAVLELMPIRQ
jgi:hypothetical protein